MAEGEHHALPRAEDVARELMWCLVNEDDQQLFEVYEAIDAAAPNAAQTAKVELAREVVFDLLDNGLIELHTFEWPPNAARACPPLDDYSLQRLRIEVAPWCLPLETDLRVEIGVLSDGSTDIS